MMKHVESIMEENKRYNGETKNLTDELKATKLLFEELQFEKNTLHQSELTAKKTIEKLRDEHETFIDSMIREHSSIVDDLKRSKIEAIELVKKQHEEKMSDVLAAKDLEHAQAIEEWDSKVKIMLQKDRMLKASYSEKVNYVLCTLFAIFLSNCIHTI